MTNKSDYYVVDKIQQLMLCINSLTDFFILYHTSQDSLPPLLQPYAERIFCYSSDILYTMGYIPLGDSLIPGSCHFPLLKLFLAHPEYNYYWTIEDDVAFSGEWSTLFDYYSSDETDLISAHIKKLSDAPKWEWWYSLNTGHDIINKENIVCAFNPVYRLSHRALQCIHESLLKGWKGHAEVVISTIIKHNSLSIKDLGGTGYFVPIGENNLFYDNQTHSHIALNIQEIRPNIIYHPIKQKIGFQHLRKNCVISAVGKNSLHKYWLENSENRSFDLHLIVYDDSFSEFYNDADFLYLKKGYKLKLVYDYLMNHPNYLEHYSYFFIPDDDIKTDAQSINRLFHLMEQYSLKIAQPALKESYYTYPMTLQEHHFILRYTNFVEMMLPCFSREALEKVIYTFKENESGWGTEFHWPLLINSKGRDLAIIDAVPMIHTQPVKRSRIEHVKELDAYLKKYHLVPNTKELGFVMDRIPKMSQDGMEKLYERRKNLILTNMRIVPLLLKKIQMKEVTHQGLDGKLSIALFLMQLAEISGAIQYKDVAEMIIREMSNQEESSLTLHSFIYGGLGILWGTYLLKNISDFTNIINKKKIGNSHEIQELETFFNCRIEELMNLPICKVMMHISEYQLRYKSNNNIMLHFCWQQINELWSIDTQMEKVL